MSPTFCVNSRHVTIFSSNFISQDRLGGAVTNSPDISVIQMGRFLKRASISCLYYLNTMGLLSPLETPMMEEASTPNAGHYVRTSKLGSVLLAIAPSRA